MRSKGIVKKLSELESVRGKILSKRIVDVKTVRKRKERPGGLSLSWDPGVGGGAGDLPDGEHHGGRGERDRHNKLNLKTEIKHQDTSIFINNINRYKYEQETVKDLVGVFEDGRHGHGGEGGGHRDGVVAEGTSGSSPRKRRKCSEMGPSPNTPVRPWPRTSASTPPSTPRSTRRSPRPRWRGSRQPLSPCYVPPPSQSSIGCRTVPGEGSGTRALTRWPPTLTTAGGTRPGLQSSGGESSSLPLSRPTLTPTQPNLRNMRTMTRWPPSHTTAEGTWPALQSSGQSSSSLSPQRQQHPRVHLTPENPAAWLFWRETSGSSGSSTSCLDSGKKRKLERSSWSSSSTPSTMTTEEPAASSTSPEIFDNIKSGIIREKKERKDHA